MGKVDPREEALGKMRYEAVDSLFYNIASAEGMVWGLIKWHNLNGKRHKMMSEADNILEEAKRKSVELHSIMLYDDLRKESVKERIKALINELDGLVNKAYDIVYEVDKEIETSTPEAVEKWITYTAMIRIGFAIFLLRLLKALTLYQH